MVGLRGDQGTRPRSKRVAAAAAAIAAAAADAAGDDEMEDGTGVEMVGFMANFRA